MLGLVHTGYWLCGPKIMFVKQGNNFLDGFDSACVSTQAGLTLLQKFCDCKRVFFWALEVITEKKEFCIV